MIRRGSSTMPSGTRSPAFSRPQPPFPTKQMFVLALCRICEPIAFMSIFPYIYFMVKDFNITDDPSKISFYAGMVTSAFTFAEFSTSVMWGRLSDNVGRKPVLLMGLAGTGISVLVFGFAQSLPVALLARALGGCLNGNIAVLQTTVAELVTVKEHQPRAYTIMPMVWCIGSIIGPMIGGALAQPVDNFPALFPPGSIWDRFPYLLPNLFSAFTSLLGVTIGVLFLEETHVERKRRRDYGVELGNYLVSCMPWTRQEKEDQKNPETQPLLDTDEPLPRYFTEEASNSPSTTSAVVPEPRSLENGGQRSVGAAGGPGERAVMRIFTRPVVLNIVSYGILALHTMTFDSLFPVLLSTPAEHEPPSLPFRFTGGFGYDTATIGFILSVQGFYSMVSTIFMFPMITRRVGPLKLFRFLAGSYFLVYLLTPYVVLLPPSLRMVGIYVMVIWKCTFSTLSYPSNAILLTNSAPSTLSLGTINGVAASTAALSRAFGPVISGLLYAFGSETGYSGLAWWITGIVAVVGAAVSYQITETPGRLDEKVDEEDAVVVVVPAPVESREPFDMPQDEIATTRA